MIDAGFPEGMAMPNRSAVDAINPAGAATTADPVLSDFRLPLRGVYYPLGFALEISTNSGEVLTAAEESWGGFQKKFFEPALRLEIGVMENGSRDCPPPPGCRSRAHLLAFIADAGNFCVCDLSRGFAFAWLTQSAAANRAYLRYYFLEAAVSTLLEALYLTPLHAACVQTGGRGVLLCGESGAGKSSLALACARSGWKFLSDDSSAIVRKRQGRIVVGNPHQMRFRESAIELFAELKQQRVTPRATGKMAIELATTKLPNIATAAECQVDYIVFLNRSEPAPSSLLPISKEFAWQYFEQYMCFGEDEVYQAQKASIHDLLTARIFEMRYRDLYWAVDRLALLVQEGN
jgi:HPr Serine kinase C-terminal domain